ARQQLADVRAGHRGRNRLVRTANVLRSVGLQVEAIDVTGAAVLDDEDARLLAAGTGAGSGRPRLQELRQAKTEQTEAANLEKIAPSRERPEPEPKRSGGTHGGPPFRGEGGEADRSRQPNCPIVLQFDKTPSASQL